jgi:hypothetical protein
MPANEMSRGQNRGGCVRNWWAIGLWMWVKATQYLWNDCRMNSASEKRNLLKQVCL